MGMTINGMVNYGTPLVDGLVNLPAVVVAFSQAVIDKTYLTWLDVSKLLIAFPEHVKLVGDTVTFQGPVAIISSVNPKYRLLAQCALGIAFGTLFHQFLKASDYRKDRYSAFPDSDYTKRGKRMRTAISLLVTVGGFYLAGRLLPTQAGIHFFLQPPYSFSQGFGIEA